MKRSVITLLLMVPLLAALLVGSALWLDYRSFLVRPLPALPSGASFIIPRGASLRQVAEQLASEGVLRHPYFFIALAHFSGQSRRIQAGEYDWPAETTPPELLARFTSGRVLQFTVTFIEGWTFRQAIARLMTAPGLTGELADLDDGEIMTRLGRPDLHPEGRFFPDTYDFTRGTPRIEILHRAIEHMDRVLATEWVDRDEDLPLVTPYQALILASIIEKETGLAKERPDIAGVFIRRLKRGMRLQADPTVIYGLGDDWNGRLRKADLRADTPYNTYVHTGLPPTPIALPGRAAIRAALHPAPGEAIFFVAKGDGSHVFSATLEDHNRAVRRYILGL